MEYYPYTDQGLSSRLAQKTGSLIAKTLPSSGGRSWQVTTEPSIEPVTVAELKTFARIITDAEDTLLEGFIKAARKSTEEYLGRALIQQTIRMLMDYWPSIRIKLPHPPLISVDKVFTLDEDGIETIYSSDNYYIMTEATPGKLILKRSVTPPINTDRDFGGFGIEFKAGYGTASTDVPTPIIEGVKLWAASLSAGRTLGKEPPPDAKKMLDLVGRTSRVMIR